MRLAGALLGCLVALSFAAAEPAKQDASKAAPAKKDTKAAPAKETKAKATKTEQKAAVDAIAASYTAIPLAERIAIQNDLVWAGDYNGIINGEFGERAIAAVKAFQKRNGGKETGVFNQPERAALAAAAKPKQDNVGWRMVQDLSTGARLGIPGKLMPNTQASGGITKWTSSRGEYQAETFRILQPGTALGPIFERMKIEPAGRKAEYSVLRPDFFVISGLQNLKKFYVRAQLRGDEVRGFTVLYDQAMAGIMEPVVVAMSSAYVAFPGGAAPPPRRKVEYASGVAVGPGHILTSRDALDGCNIVTVAGIGGADRAGDDKDKGLALLRVYGAPLKPVALAPENPKGDVTLVGVPDPQAQGGGSAVSAVKARVTETLALDPAPAVGFDGGAAVDAQGRLAGLASLKIPIVAGAAPTPVPSATLTPVETVRGFLGAQNVTTALAAAAGVEAAKGSVVRVICVRK
jgi:peptidoglycan hydrolase-like protein with peptidoglycan-binding domain